MSVVVHWEGDDEMYRRMKTYEDKVYFALKGVAEYWKAVFEQYAKENASWTDRSGNARQTLHGWVDTLTQDTVELYLSHGVEYGRWL